MSRFPSIFMLSGALPHTLHGGGGITAFSIVEGLQARGAAVTVVGLRGKFETAYDSPSAERLAAMGVPIIWIDPLAAEALPPACREIGHIGGGAYAPALDRVVLERRPDIVVCYHWESLAVAYPLRRTFALAGFVGDPAHLPLMHKRSLLRRYESGPRPGLRERVRAFVQARRLVQEQKLLLQRCDCSGAFAAHHAAWFRAHGVPACRYVRTPVPDPCADGRLTAATRARTDKPVVLLLGHLAGTATLAGIDLFMTETLPVMEREFGRDGFEVRIVGGMLDKVPPRLLERMRHPAVQLAGQINPPDGPFAESHFLVVPTPVELGIRVRILTGFSYGACVLAHRANRCGIPELEDGVNCALGDDGAQLGEHMVWFWRHPADRARLATGGRRTYETYFAPAGAGRELADLILKGRAAG